MKLHVRSFACACGIMWGIGVFILTWWIMLFEGQFSFLTLVYRGYSISPLGSIVGLVWGLVDGFIGGLIFAWIYNSCINVFNP